MAGPQGVGPGATAIQTRASAKSPETEEASPPSLERRGREGKRGRGKVEKERPQKEQCLTSTQSYPSKEPRSHENPCLVADSRRLQRRNLRLLEVGRMDARTGMHGTACRRVRGSAPTSQQPGCTPQAAPHRDGAPGSELFILRLSLTLPVLKSFLKSTL